ncbi:MAG: hypothetical protein ABFS46_00150 [Myxococcota bacterium]
MKAGSRWRSAVCSTEVMVVQAPDGEIEVSCGGAALIELGTEPPTGATLSPDAREGTLIGKRYVNEAGDLELLCTKPGEGSLSASGAALTVKGAKPLPSSD